MINQEILFLCGCLAILLLILAGSFLRLCFLSIPYQEWVKHRRSEKLRKGKRK